MILHPYCSNSGRNLIYEYIDSLPLDEKIDGYSVLQHLEKGDFDKIFFKPWEKKIYEVYFQKTTAYSILQYTKRIFIYFMPAVNRKIKQKEKTQILSENEQKS